MNPVRAVVALGSNLDGPEARVRRAFDDVGALPSTRLGPAPPSIAPRPWATSTSRPS